MSREHESDAQRWAAMIDREVVGEPLSEVELAFIEAHEHANPECAFERVLWDASLEELEARELERDREAESAGDDLSQDLDHLVAQALATYRGEQGLSKLGPGSRPGSNSDSGTATGAGLGRARGPGRSRWLRAGVVAGLAAAAGLALWLSSTTDDAPTLGEAPEQLDHDSQRSPPRIPMDLVPVDPTVDPTGVLSMRTTTEAPLGAMISLEVGLETPACISWSEPNAVVCFEGEVRVANPKQPAERRVRLDEGRLVAALDPLGPGQRFTVETVFGSVTAIGTVFAVEIHEGQAWVTVLEGQVELRDPLQRAVHAGHRTSMHGEIPSDEPSPTLVTPTALAQLVGFAGLLRASPGLAQLIVPSHAELSLTLDAHVLGADASQLMLAAGEHQLTVRDVDGGILDARTIVLTEGQPLDLTQLLSSLGPKPEPEPKQGAAVATKQPVLSAWKLADLAQKKRGAGHHAETARLYRALLEHYPDSPEAVNVPVRLGDLLASTGDHLEALEAYELYLDRDAKQLRPEAEFGRILALRALERHADEVMAISAFLAARPSDYHAAELQARQAELAPR